MSVLKMVLWFVLFLVVLTVVKLPVALVAEHANLPKNIAYEQLTGTLWSGKIKRLQIEGETLQKVEWQVSPWSLLLAKLEVTFKFGNARDSAQNSGKGRLSYSMDGLEVVKSVVRIPAAGLKKYSPLPMGDIGGRVILDVAKYRFSGPLCDALDGELVWSKSELDFGGPIAFGTITANLSCDNHNIVAAFDGNNRLGLEGQALVESPSKFGFEGFVKPDASLPKSVHNGLSMFGKPDVKGKYKIKL